MQFSLPLPVMPPRFDRDNYLLSASNDAAWNSAQAWLRSEEPALVVCGPSGAGKSHLGHILAAELNGVVVDRFGSFKITDRLVPAVIDNLPSAETTGLLNFFEEMSARGQRFVLTGLGQPSDWSGGLKDLKTRLEALPRVDLGEPDEALLRAVMAKGFDDRQLDVGQAVIEYVAPRIPRTFVAAHAFVAISDQIALTEKKKISISLARTIIDNLSEGMGTA